MLPPHLQKIAEKMESEGFMYHSIKDVTPLWMFSDEVENKEYEHSIEYKKLVSEINEVKTILNGKNSKEKHVELEKRRLYLEYRIREVEKYGL